MRGSHKVIRRFPHAELSTCGDRYHKKGCYIKLRKGKIDSSIETTVLLDVNEKGDILGIDFEVG